MTSNIPRLSLNARTEKPNENGQENANLNQKWNDLEQSSWSHYPFVSPHTNYPAILTQSHEPWKPDNTVAHGWVEANFSFVVFRHGETLVADPWVGVMR